jgi:hypothetical protein
MKTKNTKTSRNLRFKLVFDGENNMWTAHDDKYKDVIELSSKREMSQNIIDNMNQGGAFEKWQVPKHLHKSYE